MSLFRPEPDRRGNDPGNLVGAPDARAQRTGESASAVGSEQIREQPYTARPALMRLPGERIPEWRCLCPVPNYRRHAQPWLCIGDLELAVWRVAHPEVTTNDRNARCLMWMERTFGKA